MLRSDIDTYFFERSARNELYLMLPFGYDESERNTTIHGTFFMDLWRDKLEEKDETKVMDDLTTLSEHFLEVLWLDLKDYNPNFPYNIESMVEDHLKTDIFQFFMREPIVEGFHEDEYVIEAARRIYRMMKDIMAYNMDPKVVDLSDQPEPHRELDIRFDLIFDKHGNIGNKAYLKSLYLEEAMREFGSNREKCGKK